MKLQEPIFFDSMETYLDFGFLCLAALMKWQQLVQQLFMTLNEADQLIRKRARQSYTAADYVKAVAGPGYVKSLGLVTQGNGSLRDGSDCSTFEVTMEATEHERLDSYISDDVYKLEGSSNGQAESGSTARQGFAIGGHERLIRTHAYLSELTAAVYVCRVSSNPDPTHGSYGLEEFTYFVRWYPFSSVTSW
jgi:hypothetical protein